MRSALTPPPPPPYSTRPAPPTPRLTGSPRSPLLGASQALCHAVLSTPRKDLTGEVWVTMGEGRGPGGGNCGRQGTQAGLCGPVCTADHLETSAKEAWGTLSSDPHAGGRGAVEALETQGNGSLMVTAGMKLSGKQSLSFFKLRTRGLSSPAASEEPREHPLPCVWPA